MRNIAQLNFKRWAGWFRVWCLLSFGWIAYSITIVDFPWDVGPRLMGKQAVYSDQIVGDAKREISAHNREKCAKDTMHFDLDEIPAAPAKGRYDRGHYASLSRDTEFSRWERWTELYYGRKAITPNAEGQYPVGLLLITCEPAGLRGKRWFELLGTALIPPVVIPLMLFLLWTVFGAVGRWLIQGFAEPAIPKQGATESVIPDQNQDYGSAGPTAKAETSGADDPALQGLSKLLSWSAFAAMVIDYTGRAILSVGQSTGTNILAFAFIGLAAYAMIKLVLTRMTKPDNALYIGMSLFWIGSLGFMVLSFGRFL